MYKNKQKRASVLIISSFFLANFLLLLLLQGLQAEPLIPTVTLSGSQKLVDQATAHPGSSLQYTIIISNGSAITVSASLTDPLPIGLTVEPGSLTATMATTLTENAQAIAWVGTLAGYEMITISFSAAISSSLSVGESVVNTAVLTGTGQAITLMATTELVNAQLYLPFINRLLPPPSTPILQPIQITCNSDNWTVNWTSTDTDVMYELQEAHNAAFTNPTTYNTANLSQPINHTASTNNRYYYRVRAIRGTSTSSWSNSVNILGHYLDDFSDSASGWVIGETSISTVGYSGGEYLIRTKDTGVTNAIFLATSIAPEENRTNYSVEADLRWRPTASTEGLYGLVFGSNNDASKFYFAALFPDLQGYRIFFFDSTLPFEDRLQQVSDYETSSVINSGTADNHMRINRIGSNIELIVNGTSLGNWSDSTQLGSTRTGLIAVAINPNNNPVVDARYDNFRVNTCNSGTAAIVSELRQTAVTNPNPAILPAALFAPTP